MRLVFYRIKLNLRYAIWFFLHQYNIKQQTYIPAAVTRTDLYHNVIYNMYNGRMFQ